MKGRDTAHLGNDTLFDLEIHGSVKGQLSFGSSLQLSLWCSRCWVAERLRGGRMQHGSEEKYRI